MKHVRYYGTYIFKQICPVCVKSSPIQKYVPRLSLSSFIL